jgi:para-nitrobenzyl esterase
MGVKLRHREYDGARQDDQVNRLKEKTMRKTRTSIALAALALLLPPLATTAFGQAAPAGPTTPAATPAAPPAAPPAPPAANTAHYSVETTLIGKLIDDPAAAELLKKLIPGVWANEMFHSMGRDQTLKAIQQYEQDLTDAKLAEIQAAFNKIPAKAGG